MIINETWQLGSGKNKVFIIIKAITVMRKSMVIMITAIQPFHYTNSDFFDQTRK